MSSRAAIMPHMKRKLDIFDDGPASADDVSFHRDLELFLERSTDATTWHDGRVIKQSDFETTELVHGAPSGGAPGWYVRKTIDTESGAGSAYLQLWAAQEKGGALWCVPRLYECEQVGTTLTVVMERVDGSTVEELARALGPGAMLATQVLPELCRSVHALHTQLDSPLIHRDLKPSNVIMRAGDAVIIDFGSARTWHPGAETDTTHFLTRCYAPPEQFGFGQTDERTDVYALGKILYFCLTGEQPPSSCGAAECEAHGIDGELERVIARACSFDPDGRYASAAELGRAIEGALAGVLPTRSETSRGNGGAAKSTVASERRRPAGHAGGFSLGESISRFGRAVGALVPTWVGVIWNALVLFVLAMMLWQSVSSIIHPYPSDVGLSVPYLVFRNILYIDSLMVIAAYLLLDRRRLRARFPVLARRSIAQETVRGVIAMACITFTSAVVVAIVGL